MPKWLLMPEVTGNNKQAVEFSNGSQIKAVPTSDDAGRSEALSLLIVDEAAFVRNFDELWMGLYPTLSTGGRAILLSTPNGVGGQYHEIYTKAESKENKFNPIKLMWDVHPERGDDWFEKETKNMSRRQIAQELECNFNTSGDTVIHPDDIAWLQEQIIEPTYRTGYDRNFWIWEKYQEGTSYLLVADVARGDGADNSVFHVLDVNKMEVAVSYTHLTLPTKA